MQQNKIQNMNQYQIKNQNQGAWTHEEENFIKRLREVDGIENWRQIAQAFSKSRNFRSRTSKQCRQRYMNFIKFDVDRQKLKQQTKEEEQKLFILYEQLGSRWVEISKQFEMKSENCLKNKFYGSIRKLSRKINSFGKMKKRLKKPMKYESILRVLDYPIQRSNSNRTETSFLTELKSRILHIAQAGTEKMDEQAYWEIISGINKFNWSSKCRNCTFQKMENSKDSSQQKQNPNLFSSHLSFSKDLQNPDINELYSNHMENSQKKEQMSEEIRLIDLTFYQLDPKREKQIWGSAIENEIIQDLLT